MAREPVKILIAEDSEPMRLTLRVILQQEGYELLEASDGVTALLLARERLPDLVLLDLYLPGMSGIELAEQFQGWMNFVVITIEGEDQKIDACLKFGALNYIVKPIRDINLKAQVRAALAQGRKNQNLRRGIQETQVIAKAIGLLMAYAHLPEEVARQRLFRQASAERRRAASRAADIVAAFEAINHILFIDPGATPERSPPDNECASIIPDAHLD